MYKGVRGYTKGLDDLLEKNRERVVDVQILLTETERSVFRMLKNAGERFIRGRNIRKYGYRAIKRGDINTVEMYLEGGHARQVAEQVARRFKGLKSIKKTDVVKTKAGYKLVVTASEGKL